MVCQDRVLWKTRWHVSDTAPLSILARRDDVGKLGRSLDWDDIECRTKHWRYKNRTLNSHRNIHTVWVNRDCQRSMVLPCANHAICIRRDVWLRNVRLFVVLICKWNRWHPSYFFATKTLTRLLNPASTLSIEQYPKRNCPSRRPDESVCFS